MLLTEKRHLVVRDGFSAKIPDQHQVCLAEQCVRCKEKRRGATSYNMVDGWVMLGDVSLMVLGSLGFFEPDVAAVQSRFFSVSETHMASSKLARWVNVST